MMLSISARACTNLVRRSCCVSKGFEHTARRTLSPANRLRCLSALADKTCAPCERDKGSLGFMGLCENLDMSKAQSLIAEEAKGWEVSENEQHQLLIRRTWRTKDFVKALELCNRSAEVAEAEGHHPDLHVTGWNKLTVELMTHSRGGLTENDFIMAAKLNAVAKDDLLSKKKPAI